MLNLDIFKQFYIPLYSNFVLSDFINLTQVHIFTVSTVKLCTFVRLIKSDNFIIVHTLNMYTLYLCTFDIICLSV